MKSTRDPLGHLPSRTLSQWRIKEYSVLQMPPAIIEVVKLPHIIKVPLGRRNGGGQLSPRKRGLELVRVFHAIGIAAS